MAPTPPRTINRAATPSFCSFGCFQRRFDDCTECRLVIYSHLGKDLAVYIDISSVQGMY